MGVKSTLTTIERSDLLEPVSRRIGRLSELEPDWDSYGGAPPTVATREGALALCRRLTDLLGPTIGARALPTEIAPLANGGVQLEWQGDDRLIAVDIGPDGSRGYLKKVGSRRSAQYEEREGVPETYVLSLVSFPALKRRADRTKPFQG